MADPFVAEIRIFPFNYAPKGWAWCDGQILPLSQNTALFSLLGTTYGGDGQTNFALPDFRGRTPMHPEQGPGLSLHDIGETGGTETVSLIESEIPSHSHAFRFSSGTAISAHPESGSFAGSPSTNASVYVSGAPGVDAGQTSIGGSGNPHNNMQPYLTFYFCMALQGVYPPRT
jgi:microcystin-dependent protein